MLQYDQYYLLDQTHLLTCISVLLRVKQKHYVHLVSECAMHSCSIDNAVPNIRSTSYLQLLLQPVFDMNEPVVCNNNNQGRIAHDNIT